MALGAGLDWKRPDKKLTESGKETALNDWAKSNPTNYWALRHLATAAIQKKDWASATMPLETLAELYTEQGEADSAHRLLGRVYRELGEYEKETEALESHAYWAGDALETYQRLMELGQNNGEWSRVLRNAQRYLAVNPLVALPYRQLADAAEQLGNLDLAIQARQILLLFPTQNPSEQHFQLARLLLGKEEPLAKRHLLEALADAPRHQEGIQMLLTLHRPRADLALDTGTRTDGDLEPDGDSDSDSDSDSDLDSDMGPEVELEGNFEVGSGGGR
jgi:tetratricopeptide (TPR) repeat protein